MHNERFERHETKMSTVFDKDDIYFFSQHDIFVLEVVDLIVDKKHKCPHKHMQST